MDWVIHEEEFAVATTELLLWALRRERSLGVRSYEIRFNV
jgi:hypothetical protein